MAKKLFACIFAALFFVAQAEGGVRRLTDEELLLLRGPVWMLNGDGSRIAVTYLPQSNGSEVYDLTALEASKDVVLLLKERGYQINSTVPPDHPVKECVILFEVRWAQTDVVCTLAEEKIGEKTFWRGNSSVEDIARFVTSQQEDKK
jgi:hypothetical protein